jgi:hypothetical protein
MQCLDTHSNTPSGKHGSCSMRRCILSRGTWMGIGNKWVAIMVHWPRVRDWSSRSNPGGAGHVGVPCVHRVTGCRSPPGTWCARHLLFQPWPYQILPHRAYDRNQTEPQAVLRDRYRLIRFALLTHASRPARGVGLERSNLDYFTNASDRKASPCHQAGQRVIPAEPGELFPPLE